MTLQAGSKVLPIDVPRPLVRGYRDATFPSTGWTTTEAIFYRFDNLSVQAGQIYEITMNNVNLVPSVVNDIGRIQLRYNETGVATVTSPILDFTRTKQTETGNTEKKPFTAFYMPNQDFTTLSFAFTLVRVSAGTSSLGVRLFGSTSEPVHMVIKRLGADPGISGTAFTS